MSEADKLKEDVQRMFSGLPPVNQNRADEEEQSEEDLEEAKVDVRNELKDEIQKIIDQTFTKEAIIRLATEKNLTQRIGQVGIREVVDELRAALDDGLDNYIENNY